MTSVGGKLRQEREIRDMTIEQVADATGVSVVYLGAMERGEFDVLPGRAFGKLYIRAYAEVLDFDPKPLIEEYDREYRPDRAEAPEPPRLAPAGSRPVAEAIARWKAGRTEAVEPPSAEGRSGGEVAPPGEPSPAPAAAVVATGPVEGNFAARAELTTPARTPPRRNVMRWVAPVGVVVILAGAYVGFRRTAAPEPVPVAPLERPSPVRPPPPLPQPETPPRREPPRRAPAVEPAAGPNALTVPEFGVGRRIVDRSLEGETDRFTEGDVAVFYTRVLGGTRGERVRHVWIFDGHAQQSIELRLGGADWRTHSSKTLYRSGSWTVELRDPTGRVLATSSFTCGAGGR